MLMGGGLIGVFVADLRSRQLRDLYLFAEGVRTVAVFYDGLVVPGALLLLGSGTWLVVRFYGWGFLHVPWLAAMMGLFAFEFIEGNTVTRVYFMRLRRKTREAIATGRLGELPGARERTIPTFTHFLDIPLLLVIVMLGTLRPDSWAPMIVGTVIAIAVATFFTIPLPRLYPWVPPSPRTSNLNTAT
jgi:Predicted integral membrane protein (DUF2269)